MNLIFTVNAGKQTVLTINGHEPEKKLLKEIKAILNQPYSRHYALKESKSAIIAYYNHKGFFKAAGEWKIQESDTAISANFELNQGEQFSNIIITFAGNIVFDSHFLYDVLGTRKKEILFAELMQNFDQYRDVLLLEYANKGYYATVITEPAFLYEGYSATARIPNIGRISFPGATDKVH